MLIKKFKECAEIIAGDNTILRELISGINDPVACRYSLAHARVPVGKISARHALKTTEVYYILEGSGVMHINDEQSPVQKGDCIYIPPQAVQCIENTGAIDLDFICIVDPAWSAEDEVIL